MQEFFTTYVLHYVKKYHARLRSLIKGVIYILDTKMIKFRNIHFHDIVF